MKFVLALLAVLAVVGLGQAHKTPDFGKGPLHEDIQDILDLIPMEETAEVFLDYLAEDEEVKAAARYLQNSNLLRDLVVEVEAIPEVIKLLNYLQKEGLDIYNIVNMINKVFDIKPLEPPSTYSATMKRTGGIAGFFKDVKGLFYYDDFIRIYVRKMKNSPAFVDFIKQLRSNNFQQLVNKVHAGKSFQFILNHLKRSGVNTRIVADIMFIVLGITVPQDATYEPSLIDEMMDFAKLIPGEEIVNILMKYVTEDAEVKRAAKYPLTPEFHDLLRNVEALKEFHDVVFYFHKVDLDIVESIKLFHKIIGMKDYVPPKIENIFESEIGIQKVGEGLKAMLDDILKLIPVDKMQALFDKKMKTSKVWADYVGKMTSTEYQKIINAMASHKTFLRMYVKCKEAGLDLLALQEFNRKILPGLFPKPIFDIY